MPITLTLLALSVAAFTAQIALGDRATAALGLVPARPSPAALVTYMFPHAAWWHLGLNMGGLLALGRYAEPALGPWRFLAAYLGSGVATGCAIAGLGPEWSAPMVGASGAIGGTFGVYLAARRPPAPPGWAAAAGAVFLLVWAACRTSAAAPTRADAAAYHAFPFLLGWAVGRAAGACGLPARDRHPR